MLGLKRGTVSLCKHDPEWEAEAERTIKRLRLILGGAANDIQHIGSTAVAAIKAKPIIDIAVSVDSFDVVLEKRTQLEAAGFFYRPACKPENQLLFASGSFYDGTGDIQTHFIHVVKRDSMEWVNYLNFRDYLNEKPEIAEQYEALKERLAAENPNDEGREKYLAGKHDFIVFTLRKALVRSFLGKTVRVVMDRPAGYVHKKEGYTLVYPINYGYIPGVLGGDGEELDVYIVGTSEPLSEFTGKIVAIVHRNNDVEDKLIAATADAQDYSSRKLMQAVAFQEKYYDSFIETL